jgi:hypothetical protein
MDALEILGIAKNIWAAAHEIGGKYAEKTPVGKAYLLVQGTVGGAIVDTANGDSLDEQLVGFGGDVVGGFAASFIPGGWVVNVGLIATGNSVGDNLKSYYKSIKSDIASTYWKYEKDYYFMAPGGVMLHYDYAKVLYDRNGARFDAGYQVVQQTYELQYNGYMANKNSILTYVNTSVLNVKIEKSGGVLKVTLPDGTIYAQGDNGSNTIYGASKNDWIYGMGGNDVLYGNDGGDYLDGGIGDDILVGGIGSDGLVGGEGNDTLIGTNGYGDDDGVLDTLNGGNGYDSYIAGNHDRIYDNDGSGAVYLGGEHLDGGEKKVIKHIGVTTTNYTKTFIYCECKTVTKWSDVSTDEWKESEEYYIDQATGTKYILSGSTLSVISCIRNDHDQQLLQRTTGYPSKRKRDDR